MAAVFSTLHRFLALLVVFVFHTVVASFHGICYSPYSKMGVCRTAKELDEDVALMKQHTTRIRLYSMECPDVMNALLKKATNGEVSLLLGVWIENSPRDAKEIGLLLKYLRMYPAARIDGIVVGNEVIFKSQANGAFMAAKVIEVKQKVGGLAFHEKLPTLASIPIYSVEETPDTAVATASDAVGVNIHPFYDWTLQKGVTPDETAQAAVKSFEFKYNLNKSKFPGKQIIVTEIGWPTNSDPYAGDYQQGSEMLQLKFAQAFQAYVAANPIPYYWFEFKNADWKYFSSKYHSELHFGLVNSIGEKKSSLLG